MILEIGLNLYRLIIYVTWIWLLNNIIEVLVSLIHVIIKRPEESKIEQTYKIHNENDEDEPEIDEVSLV